MMVIEKVHGLQATSMSLNDRFTMLAAAPAPRPRTPRRRSSAGGLFTPNMKYQSQNYIQQLARRLEQQAKRQSLRQRLGVGPGALRRFGSESSLPGLRRANSFGNLSQRGVKNRLSWRQSNGNLSRALSFGSLPAAAWRGRGVRRRGGRALRGRLRGGVNFFPVNRVPQRGPRARRPGGAARGRGAARGQGRGGILRSQAPKPVPSKEELDHQLDVYMAGSKLALDAELDTYMKNAMDAE